MKCLKYSVNPHSYRITKPGYHRKSGMGFFSCGSNSLIASHLCIVEQVENSKIYTIEGYSNNMVRQNSYPVEYVEILGYGNSLTQ